jgi:hypothetical protein
MVTTILGSNELFHYQNLPREIWLMIFSYNIDSTDLRSLSLVSKHLRELCQPLLFTNIILRAGCAVFDKRGDKTTWFSYSDSSDPIIVNMHHRLQFISSPRISPFIRSITISFERVTAEDQPPPERERSHKFLDEIVASLPKMSSLQELTFVSSPIFSHYLQILHHSILNQAFVTFIQCTPLYSASEQSSTPLRAVGIEGYFNRGINHGLLLGAVWTQSLVELTIRSLQNSTILERELTNQEPLTMLTTLELDEASFKVFSSYFHLFSNLHRLKMDAFGPLVLIPPLPSSALAKIDILECPFEQISLFSGLSFRELTLSAFYGWRHGRSQDKMEATIRPIRHLLVNLTVLELFNYLEDCALMGALLVHCHRLRRLKLVIDFPEQLYFFDPSLRNVLEVMRNPQQDYLYWLLTNCDL